MKKKILFITGLLVITPPVLACDKEGFTMFAGFGYDYGASGYAEEKDYAGDAYRTHKQFVLGAEYNWKFFRLSAVHNSSDKNNTKPSFGDTNMIFLAGKVSGTDLIRFFSE